MTHVPVSELVAVAQRFRDGVPQAGEENIHAEWQRLLAGIAAHLVADDLATFTRWRTIAQTMFIGDYGDTARQLAALRTRADWTSRWEPALVESPVGGAWPSALHPPSSGNQIRQAYVLARFEDEMGATIDAFDQVIEFGGGFGALCLLVNRLGFRGRYVIVDNQPVRGLQRWYLAENGLDLADDGDLSGRNGVCTVPNTALVQAVEPHETSRTAFVANWSLSETPTSFRDEVFRALRAAHVEAIWVTYQRTFAIDNARYFVTKLQDFTDVYESSVRPFQTDAHPDDYYYGHGCLALRRVPGRRFPATVDGLEAPPFDIAALRYLTIDEVFERARRAIVAHTPLSILRLGDGEARVIGFPKYVSRSLVADIWQTWFGRPDFTEGQIERVKEALKQACLGADVVGVPKAEPDIHSEFGRVKALLPREGFVEREATLCHAGLHFAFYREGRYAALLAGLARVGLLGPRDLTGIFPAISGVPEVVWLAVPPEMKFSDVPEAERARLIQANVHLATRYAELMDSELPRTLARWPGLVVLVGAGILGKIYCHRIKELGGVAIDVGSMMDVWAGLKTRDNQKFAGLRQVVG